MFGARRQRETRSVPPPLRCTHCLVRVQPRGPRAAVRRDRHTAASMIGVTALLPGSPDRPGCARARRAGRSARPPRPARRRPSSPPRATPLLSGRPPSAGCAASWRRRRPPRRCGRLPVPAPSQAIWLAAGGWQAHRPRQSSRPASSDLLRQRHVCAALQRHVAAPGAQVASAVLSRWAHRPTPQHHNAPPGCAGGRHRTSQLCCRAGGLIAVPRPRRRPAPASSRCRASLRRRRRTARAAARSARRSLRRATRRPRMPRACRRGTAGSQALAVVRSLHGPAELCMACAAAVMPVGSDFGLACGAGLHQNASYATP